MRVLSWLVYIPLQVLALPFGILGGLLVAYRQIGVSKRIGASQTAIEIFNGRWTMDLFGMRPDPGAAKLGPALTNTSTLGLRLALFPLWVKWKISGEWSIYYVTTRLPAAFCSLTFTAHEWQPWPAVAQQKLLWKPRVKG